MHRTALLRPLAALAACAALAPAVAACGGSGGNPDADPAAVVPARAPVYVEAAIRPEGDAAEAVDELGRKLAGVDDVGAELRRLIEKEARESDKDFSYKEDVEPWLGDRVGLFFHELQGAEDEPEGAIVLTTKDADKARETLEAALAVGDDGKKVKLTKRTHRKVEYRVDPENDATAMVGDYAIFGDESGVKAAIDAQEAESLAEADAFKKARDQVPSEGLGFAYLGLRQLLSGLGPQGAALRPLLEGAGDSIAIALTAEKDLIQLDTASLGVSGGGGAATGPGKVFESLPQEAWLAAGLADVGGQISRALEQFGQLGALGGVDVQREIQRQTGLDVERDLIAWMGDAGVFVTGESVADIGGGLVVESKDRAATRRAIPRIAQAVARLGGASVGPAPSGVDAGATLRFARLPLPVALALDGDRFVIGVGEAAIEAATGGGGTLGDNPAFEAAQGRLGDGMEPAFFVDMGPVSELASTAGLEQQGEPGRRVQQALEALTAIVAGTRREGDIARARVVVTVK